MGEPSPTTLTPTQSLDNSSPSKSQPSPSGNSATQLKKIYYISGEDKFVCGVCKDQYARFGNLLNHISDEHKDIDIKEYLTCLSCKKVFDTYQKLNRHMKTVHEMTHKLI